MALSKLYTKKEVAGHLRCSPRTVDNLIARGKLQCMRITPRLVRITHEQLERYQATLNGDAAREAMNN